MAERKLKGFGGEAVSVSEKGAAQDRAREEVMSGMAGRRGVGGRCKNKIILSPLCRSIGVM